MSIGYQRADGKIGVGGMLDSRQQNALAAHSPSADFILENAEALNEEIVESHPEYLANKPEENQVSSPVARPAPKRVPRSIQKQQELAEKLPVEEEEADFDSVLDVDQPDPEEEPAGIFASEEEKRRQMLALLEGFHNAPNARQIDAWKHDHGENGVQMIAFDEKLVFIYTYLKTGQYRKLREKIAELEAKGNINGEEELKERVVKYCTLWPQLDTNFFYTARAGVIESLFQAIWQESYFLDPRAVQMLTVQL